MRWARRLRGRRGVPLTLALCRTVVLALLVAMMFCVLLVVVGSGLPWFLGRYGRRRGVSYLFCIGRALGVRLLNLRRRTRRLRGRVYGGRLLLGDLLFVGDRRRDVIRLFRWPLVGLTRTETL